MREKGNKVDRAGAAAKRSDGNVAQSRPTEVPIDSRLSIAREEGGGQRSVWERKIPGLDKAQHPSLGRTVTQERETEDVGDEGLERVAPRRVRPEVGEGVDNDVPQTRVAKKEIELETIEASRNNCTLRPKMRGTLEQLSDDRDQQRALVGQ